MGYTVHGILQAGILEWVAFSFSRGSYQPRIKPRSSTLKANSLPAEPQGRPTHTRGGSLSLLQRIFPTQELYWDLLHWRQILYQLSYREQNQDLNLCRSSSKAYGGALVYITAVNVHQARYKIITHASGVLAAYTSVGLASELAVLLSREYVHFLWEEKLIFKPRLAGQYT